MSAETTPQTYLPSGLPKPVARNDGLDRPYWEAVLRGELVVQECQSCQERQWGPESICRQCYSFDLGWVEVEPRGTIYSWERPWHPVAPTLAAATPYIVVLVELAGIPGTRMVGNLLGDPLQTVTIGDPVRAVFEMHDGYALVQWSVER